MSFGRFVCIYGIGYVTMLVGATLMMCIYLYRTYRDLWTRIVERVCSNDDDISVIRSLVGIVYIMLLWPVMIPRNVIRLVHECEAEYKKHYL